MNDRTHDDLSAIERRLARRQTPAPSPGLRRRVLAGIDAALAGERSLARRDPARVIPGMLAAACGAVALTFALLVLVLDKPTPHAGRDQQTVPLLSLAERASAVGIAIDASRADKALVATASGRHPRGAAASVLRPTDVARFLEGDL